jgi:hypothetical protein
MELVELLTAELRLGHIKRFGQRVFSHDLFEKSCLQYNLTDSWFVGEAPLISIKFPEYGGMQRQLFLPTLNRTKYAFVKKRNVTLYFMDGKRKPKPGEEQVLADCS